MTKAPIARILPDILIEDERWANLALEKLVPQCLDALVREIPIEPDTYEFALLAADDAKLFDLNNTHRGIEKPTNVLSWPSEDLAPEIDGKIPNPPTDSELGDIAISYDTCAREASEQNKSLRDHATHLIVHGTLHLLGYDHDTDANAALMERTEIKTLEILGIDSPY